MTAPEPTVGPIETIRAMLDADENAAWPHLPHAFDYNGSLEADAGSAFCVCGRFRFDGMHDV